MWDHISPTFFALFIFLFLKIIVRIKLRSHSYWYRPIEILRQKFRIILTNSIRQMIRLFPISFRPNSSHTRTHSVLSSSLSRLAVQDRLQDPCEQHDPTPFFYIFVKISSRNASIFILNSFQSPFLTIFSSICSLRIQHRCLRRGGFRPDSETGGIGSALALFHLILSFYFFLFLPLPSFSQGETVLMRESLLVSESLFESVIPDLSLHFWGTSGQLLYDSVSQVQGLYTL